MNTRFKIARRIAYYRKKSNLTQKELANKIGISSSRIANYETAYREPSVHILLSIAKALNVSIEKFV
jgi:transcriptional regulator with XRE-family HTH domain